MNNKELLKELEKKMARYGYCDTQTHIGLFIKEYEALTKDEKPIRLKDVIKRIQGFDDGTKFKWTYDILQELGSDFSSKIFHEAYQQGRFDEGIENYYGQEKVKIPQFVADWYEENKDDFEGNLFRCIYEIYKKRNDNELTKFEEWIIDAKTKPFKILVNMHQFGYEVEKEPKYKVRVKGICGNHETLNREKHSNKWLFSDREENSLYGTHHTRKELEEANFGWVFDCEGIEIEEVE